MAMAHKAVTVMALSTATMVGRVATATKEITDHLNVEARTRTCKVAMETRATLVGTEALLKAVMETKAMAKEIMALHKEVIITATKVAWKATV